MGTVEYTVQTRGFVRFFRDADCHLSYVVHS